MKTLISHPETAAEYAELKRRLFENYQHDRDGYTAAKGEFIKKITEKARKDKNAGNPNEIESENESEGEL